MSNQPTTRAEPPSCPGCGRTCQPGITWAASNFCRGLVLLSYIDENPGLSGWELAQISGLDYQEASRGLAKLREWGAVRTESEDRGPQGGNRFRYWPGDVAPRGAFTCHALSSRSIRYGRD